ncbi:glucose uptake protein [Lactobacillus selangorensis]|uniref:Glucose uptake protein n=1 Tax=Lactobacillus selangorensis TaxID=81857 RepID=A0A0R2G0I9_9LACO|nr:GRP family sugar transporter [Lactobacillus selangorensis]KRN27981.1 glucose uptake protein [Lactobacillus selangorensis]KRN30548.1 glucose uptake protein [Lactobacillus selangorensis]
MKYLIAIIPAIGWGIQPLIVGKIGGKPSNQILGTGIGAFIVGLIILMMSGTTSGMAFWLSLLSGLFWVIGQVGQYISYTKMSVANTMPITTGLQVIGTSLIGVLIFGEWQGTFAKWIGAFAIVLIIIGVTMTTVKDKSDGKAKEDQSILAGLAVLVPTTIGYWVYSALPKMVKSSSLEIFFPQMLGILLGALIYVLISRQGQAFRQKESWQSVSVGLVFGVSALAYIFSAKENGVATAYVITQLNVVIATLGSILILHEHKSHRELVFTLSGLVLIVIGSVATAFL